MTTSPHAPEVFPPFGLSDRNCVILKPKSRVPNQQTRKSVTVRDMRESTKACLGRYFSSIDWPCVESQDTCEEKLKVFRGLVGIELENIMPEKTIKVYPKDAPWISVKLKGLIRQRQAAFLSNKHGLSYKFYRNAVNRERKRSKAMYYTTKVRDLKGVNPAQVVARNKQAKRSQEAKLQLVLLSQRPSIHRQVPS